VGAPSLAYPTGRRCGSSNLLINWHPSNYLQCPQLQFPTPMAGHTENKNALPTHLSNRGPSLVAASKTCKEVLYHGHLENISDDGRILHRLCRDGEELAKQVHQTVQLANHANDRPSNHDQHDPTEETNNPCCTMLPHMPLSARKEKIKFRHWPGHKTPSIRTSNSIPP
jgi:hypothetical protein